MPILRTLQLRDLSQKEFDELDVVVMRHAYASQNKFRRLFDERVYENDMALRLRAEGCDVHTQVPIAVGHGSFEKIYRLDLVVNSMLYELKVVAALLAEHKAQGLHYAMLQDIRRVKLINFRTAKVQGDLHYNPVTESERHDPRFITIEWTPLTAGCERLMAHVRSLVGDWGTHLDSRLYKEALIHHFGGEAECSIRLPVMRDGAELGTHLVSCQAPEHAFVVTSFFRKQELHRRQLQRMVENLGDVRAIQWINLNRAQIELATLLK